jgi:alpha-glucoside transport system permease protein
MATESFLERRSDRFRQVLLLLVAVATIAGLIVSLRFLADQDGAQNLLASVYDLIGNRQAGDLARQGRGDALLAKLLMAVVAIIVGVGGIWVLYTTVSLLVQRLHPRYQARIMPWVFVGPAIALVTIFLVYPVVQTVITSVTEGGGREPAAIANYRFALTDRTMLGAFRNNLIWLIAATGGSVILGLLIASLFDRIRREALAKTFIFLPLAISLVGASVIWGFVYAWRPPGQSQYGLLNAIWTGFGGQPIPWVQTPPVNTYALITIMIWLQTGFAMVILSAAIKGVSTEIIEAARLDGANERSLFLRIIVPMIKGSIITVATTIAITVIKIFDIVYVMTGGRFDTDVVANKMFIEMFQFGNYGHASALAVLLFLAVVPIMIINVRNLRKQGIGA